MQYLLLSNSTMAGQAYFEWPKKHILSFLGDEHKKLIFIPFAGVSISYDAYYKSVNEAFTSMGYQIDSIHQFSNKKEALSFCEGVVVGGGNTFHLLNELYKYDLIDLISDKIKNGIPFIGWSAGSNIAGPSIKTTNDMPIVEPHSFNALNFFPWQINPHYTEKTIDGHGGESRDQRILEFLEVNKNSTVIGLPEGMFIQRRDNIIELGGTGDAKVFKWNEKPVVLPAGDKINRYLIL